MDLRDRLDFAVGTARAAGDYALPRFREIEGLTVEAKGHQDLVSDADRATEDLIRDRITRAFPDDGIVGEERDRVTGTTGYDWVIDPIDGTANFVRGIPQWCVSIACAKDGVPVVGAIFEPCSGEAFRAARGLGAFVGDRRLRVASATSLASGSVGAGVSSHTGVETAVRMVRGIMEPGGLFFRNASGALTLAYVAAGRLLGHVEPYMNAWDCYAAMVMIEEAGGRLRPVDTATAMERGTAIVAGAPGVFAEIERIADTLWDGGSAPQR